MTDIEQARAVLAAMSKGEAFPTRIVDASEPPEMIAAVARSILASPGTTLFGVNVNGNPDTVELGPDERCVAYTGNGPTSEANAVGVAYLLNNAPAWLDELEALRAQVEKA